METLASPVAAAVLAILGLLATFMSTWIDAVDVAVGRMSLAYAEDLEEEGRKNAHALRSAVSNRKSTGLALTNAKALTQASGTAFLTILCLTQFANHGWPWWLMVLVTLAVLVVIRAISLSALSAMLRGERYVYVALAGAPLANRLIGSAQASPLAPHRKRRESDQSHQWSRLDLADDLRELADEVSEGNPEVLEEEDKEILRSVLELGQTRIAEVMVPRGEMVVISRDSTAAEALALFVTSGFSRVPVVGKTVDDVSGVLYLKDVVRRLQNSPASADVRVTDLMRPAEFVPEMKLADDELRTMQANNTHLALAVDEYGGIAGLVTAEDILEEVVGELDDEHDRPKALPRRVGPNSWVVASSYSLDDLADLVGSRVEDDDVYSVGGLLAKKLGKVVEPGAQADVGDLHFQAGDQVGRRGQIKTVEVTKNAYANEPNGSNPDGIDKHDEHQATKENK